MTIKTKLNRTLDYIENNLDKHMDVQRISEFNHYSKYHFSRMFLSEMNSSIMTYIRTRRIIRSKHTLLQSNDQITNIAFMYGFNNIDTYIRSFKTVFGVTPTFYRQSKALSNTDNKKETIMTTYTHIKTCNKAEKLSQLESIQEILDLSEMAHKNGLFALEECIKTTKSSFLCKAIELIVDGTDPDTIRSILNNYMYASDYTDVELLERTIYFEGILLIQQGYFPFEIRSILISLLGEEVSDEVINFFNSTTDHEAIFKRFMTEAVVLSHDLHLEKEFKHLDKRRLQRITRECDLLTLIVASIGLNQTLKQAVVDTLSKRTQKNFNELYSLIGDMTLPQIIDSQNAIIQTIQKLRRDNDI